MQILLDNLQFDRYNAPEGLLKHLKSMCANID